MTNNVAYSGEGSFIVFRFYDHLKLGLKTNIQDHTKNWREKIGDLECLAIKKN